MSVIKCRTYIGEVIVTRGDKRAYLSHLVSFYKSSQSKDRVDIVDGAD